MTRRELLLNSSFVNIAIEQHLRSLSLINDDEKVQTIGVNEDRDSDYYVYVEKD